MKFFSVRFCAILLVIAMLLPASACIRRDETPAAAAPAIGEGGPEAEETAEEPERENAGEIAETASPEPVPTEEPIPAAAAGEEEETVPEEPEETETVPDVPAEDITAQTRLFKEMWRNPWHIMYYASGEITDGDYLTGFDFSAEQVLEIHSDIPFRYVYVTWWDDPCPYYVKIGSTNFMTGDITYEEEKTLTRGEYGILHDLTRLPEEARSAYIVTTGEARLSDIRIFTEGRLPDDVQAWEPPCGEADALIFADRAGDEAAYFGAAAALLAEENAEIQCCYLAKEYGMRLHEQLNALWALGMCRYPILGPFPNVYVKNLERAKEVYDREDMVAWQVSLIRQFRPLVVLGHDRLGENGDFAHILSAAALEEAASLAGDASCKTGGEAPWELPKLYLHMAEENEIWLDAEKPLEHYDGRSAVQAAEDALERYGNHQYEHRALLDVSAAPGTPQEEADNRFDCRRFGLVRSMVGEDSGNDLLEHTEKWRGSHS